MKKVFLLSLVVVTLFSCSEYQKALNKEDVAQKYVVAEKMYEKGKYNKAIRLFEQIAPGFRGKPEAEKMYYMYAKSSYEMKQYAMSSHLFERFIANFPASDKVEEAWLLAGKSYTELSPKYSKEQEDTYKAINKLQEFINLYPNSEHAVEANQIITNLNQKLEKKYFEIAKQYNIIAGYTRDYNASIVALDNFLIDYPGTIYTEDALYYKFDSMYHLAINSVERRKKERLEQAKEAYDVLIRHNSENKYKSQTDKMLKDIEEQLLKKLKFK